MTGRGDEVQEDMNPVVPEARVTLNARLFGQDIVILSLKVSDNFLETNHGKARMSSSASQSLLGCTYANSLSMLSPKPGVSTIVSAMRTPSSSSSKPSKVLSKTADASRLLSAHQR